MAESLNQENVVPLRKPPRAKAKAEKPQTRAKRTKPAAPAPREVPTRARSVQMSDADLRLMNADKVIALHGKHRAIDNQLETLAAQRQEISLQKKEVRAAIQSIYPLALYDEAYDELRLKTKRVDLEQKEKLRSELRYILGLPAGEQKSLVDEMEKREQAGAYWENLGYREGIEGLAADPRHTGVPPENNQDYLRGHGDASAHNARGLKRLNENAPPSAAPLDDPFWVGWDEDHEAWSPAQKQRFRSWYAELSTDAEVDIDHAGASDYFDELSGEPAGT